MKTLLNILIQLSQGWMKDFKEQSNNTKRKNKRVLENEFFKDYRI